MDGQARVGAEAGRKRAGSDVRERRWGRKRRLLRYERHETVEQEPALTKLRGQLREFAVTFWLQAGAQPQRTEFAAAYLRATSWE